MCKCKKVCQLLITFCLIFSMDNYGCQSMPMSMAVLTFEEVTMLVKQLQKTAMEATIANLQSELDANKIKGPYLCQTSTF